MPENTSQDKFNKNISVALVLAILVTGTIGSCTSTPSNEQPEKTLLTISVGSQVYNYSLNDLTVLENITGQGSYINKVGNIIGPSTFTGVPLSVLLHTIPSLPTNYTVQTIAIDRYARNYTLNEVNGHALQNE